MKINNPFKLYYKINYYINWFNTFSAYPVPCLLLFYCAMIKIWWKFIITSVLKFHFNIYTWDQLLPIIGTLGIFAIEKVIDSNKGLSSTLSILILLITVVASVVHLSLFAYGTVYQIAAHLKINVFTIKPKD